MKSHILIVDDDKTSRNLYFHLFNSEGYRVSSASNGEEALLILENTENVDLIITDIEMPNLSGIELARVLKEKNSSIPLLIISGTSDNEKISELKNLGYNDCLSKPVRLAILRESVENLILKESDKKEK